MPNPHILKVESHLKKHATHYEHVIAFGSYARGEAYSSSDFDLLLIDEKFNGWNVFQEGDDSALDFNWPADLPPVHMVCCSPEEFKKRYCKGDEMVTRISEEGYAVVEPFGLVDYVNSIDCSEYK